MLHGTAFGIASQLVDLSVMCKKTKYLNTLDLILKQKRNIVLISSAVSDQPYTCANDLWLAFPSYACVVACDN